jgi:hypothetical protein
MSPGSYISLTLHASLVGWLLFNGDFEHKPIEQPVPVVSVVSSEMFDIMVNNIAPVIKTELDAASRQPSIEDTQAPAGFVTDKAPLQVPQSLSPVAENDALPETVPDQLERMEEVVTIPPLELTAPEIGSEAPEALATSLPPKPRPAPRIAPVAVAPSTPDMDIGEITRDAATPQPEPVQVVKEQAAKAPEAAAPEIVTEAEKSSEAVEVSTRAPPRTVRPQRRSAPRPVAETPIDPPEPTSVPIDPLAAALAEALSGTTSEPETQGTTTEALAPQVIRGMQLAISPCWNLGASSSAALFTTVVVGMELTIDGKPLTNSIYLVGYDGGDDDSAQRAFETAQRAIKECGAQGFELPTEQYSAWRNVEITFNPEKMRVR